MNAFAELPAAQQNRLSGPLSLRCSESRDSVADLLIFLASDRTPYIPGALLNVPGGKLTAQLPGRVQAVRC